jgi:hypothetical protein
MRTEAILAVAQAESREVAARRFGLDPVEVERMVDDRQDVAQEMRDTYLATRAYITGRGPYGEALNCHHCGLPLGRQVYTRGCTLTMLSVWARGGWLAFRFKARGGWLRSP